MTLDDALFAIAVGFILGWNRQSFQRELRVRRARLGMTNRALERLCTSWGRTA